LPLTRLPTGVTITLGEHTIKKANHLKEET